MTSSIQRIQAAISQAEVQASPAPASQSLVCSFDIEGRNQEGYLGVQSIAQVTPPSFPKAAFQLPKHQARRKTASPIITLKRPQPQGAVSTSQALMGHQPTVTGPSPTEQSRKPTASFHAKASSTTLPYGPTSTELGIQSSVSVDVFQAVASHSLEASKAAPILEQPSESNPAAEELESLDDSPPVTAELLASLFEQADALPTESLPEGSAPAAPGSQLRASTQNSKAVSQPGRQAMLAPASEAEQAAARALAQSLGKAPHHSSSLDSPSALDPSLAQPEDKIKPIETVAPPALPRSKAPEISTHQNSTNPMLPLELLQDIGKEVIIWQQALQTVHQKIQALYQEGPILNGWLEQPLAGGAYQLCGLDETGQAWRRPCHPQQLHGVSFAISRYKKLRSLLGEKQQLDQRIQRLSEALTMLRLRLRAY